jgi:hypothetical protein
MLMSLSNPGHALSPSLAASVTAEDTVYAIGSPPDERKPAVSKGMVSSVTPMHIGRGAVLSLAKVWLGSHNRAIKLIKVIRISSNLINDGILLRARLSKP